MRTDMLDGLKVAPDERVEEAAAVRASLPGQAARIAFDERRSRIIAEFGMIYSGEEVTKRIRATLRMKIPYVRVVRATRVDRYSSFMPDKALLAYRDAKASGLFDGFYVLEPAYRDAMTGADPWLVGYLGRSDITYGSGTWDHDVLPGDFVILAYWD